MEKSVKIIYLPIEIIKRELDSKIYLMKKIISSENLVIIGHRGDEVADYIKPGIYFYKDHATHSFERFSEFKKNGWKIAALDEEGLIIGTEEAYKNRACKETMKKADIIFSWGKRQYQIIKNEGVNIICAGHFRFDYFKENRKVVKINKRLSVLINTRFTETNSILGNKEFYKSAKYWLCKVDESEEDFYRRYNIYLDNERKIYEEFVEVIKKLDADNDIEQVIIRPHPMEGRLNYTSLVKNLSKTTLSNERHLIDDFRKADLIIHDACTTAVEGAAMGLPVYSLRPNLEGPVYGAAVNKFSINSTSADELMQRIKTHCNQILNEEIHEYIFNFKENINAGKLICSSIEELEVEKIPIKGIADIYKRQPPFFLWKKIEYNLHLLISTMTKNINKTLLPEYISKINYSKAKYDLTYNELCNRVRLQLDDQLPHVYISKIGVNSYAFTKEKIPGAKLIVKQ